MYVLVITITVAVADVVVDVAVTMSGSIIISMLNETATSSLTLLTTRHHIAMFGGWMVESFLLQVYTQSWLLEKKKEM